MGNYGVTAANVRLMIGIGSSDISDTNMDTIITDSEAEVDQLLKTKFIPTLAVEQITNTDGSNVAMLRHTPVNRIEQVMVGTDAGVNPCFTRLYPDSGKLVLTDSGEKTEFDDTEDRNNYVKYYYSKLEDTTTDTTTTSATSCSAGTATAFDVGTTVGFVVGDYVKIESVGGTDTNIEITTLTGTDTTNNQLSAKLSWNHESGSVVTKMQTPNIAKELVRVTGAIRCCMYMIGATYTFATSYSIPELSATKGVPYPHFQKDLDALVERRNYLLQRYRPQPAISV